MSTVNDIKNTLTTVLSGSAWWGRFIGSQFASYLILFLSNVVKRCEQVAQRALQESYLSQATTRAAILAGAESRSYVGKKASPSKGKANVVNASASRITLASHLQLIAENQVRYMIDDHIDIGAGQSALLNVSQVEIVTLSYTVSEKQSFLTITIPNDYTDMIHKMVVRVDGEVWSDSFKFRNTTSESLVYMESYKATDQYAIRFGNDINGKAPEEGAEIEIDLWLTNGETTLLDDQVLSIVEDQDVALSDGDLVITTSTQITGGEQVEDIESIRNSALYYDMYDNQVVWDGDYKAFIKANVSNLVWLNVWGEKGQEDLTGVKDFSNINKIFICAYSSAKSDADLGAEILSLFDGKEAYNEVYEIASRVDAPFTVSVTGQVFDSANAEDSEQAVKDELLKAYGKDVKDKGIVHQNNIWETINQIAAQNGIYKFQVVATGLLDDLPINTYQYLDMESSSVNFTYPKV